MTTPGQTRSGNRFPALPALILELPRKIGYALSGSSMKLIKKNLTPFLIFLILGLIIGTLTWGLLERLIALGGGNFSLNAGPVGFDLGVISLYIQFNPGSLLGAGGGVLLFRSL